MSVFAVLTAVMIWLVACSRVRWLAVNALVQVVEPPHHLMTVLMSTADAAVLRSARSPRWTDGADHCAASLLLIGLPPS